MVNPSSVSSGGSAGKSFPFSAFMRCVDFPLAMHACRLGVTVSVTVSPSMTLTVCENFCALRI